MTVQGQLFAIALGAFAILLGGGGLANAVFTLRRRRDLGPTYGTMGGPVYSALQFGCAGALMLLGVAVVVAVLVLRR